jgi:Protein of unknown function (DUF1275)
MALGCAVRGLFLVAERQELRGVSGETMAEPALVARAPSKRGDDFVEAARGLVVATMLAALAGMVDVIGYPHLKGLFVSFMSGNSTQRAAALGRGDLGVMLHNAVRIKALPCDSGLSVVQMCIRLELNQAKNGFLCRF